MKETFRIPRLTERTPSAAVTRLEQALAAVEGVEGVEILRETNEFAIENEGADRREVVEAAARVGFLVHHNI